MACDCNGYVVCFGLIVLGAFCECDKGIILNVQSVLYFHDYKYKINSVTCYEIKGYTLLNVLFYSFIQIRFFIHSM